MVELNFRTPGYAANVVEGSCGMLPPNSDYYTFEGMSKDIGIEFIDHDLSCDRNIDKEELQRLDPDKMTWVNPAHYPLASVNQVEN